MTQEEFNTMLAVGISQGLPGSYYTSRYKNGEEIDRRLGNAAVPAVGDNILINADFRNPVNRNGKTEYSGDTYTIDCWKTYIGVSMWMSAPSAAAGIPPAGARWPSINFKECQHALQEKSYGAGV